MFPRLQVKYDYGVWLTDRHRVDPLVRCTERDKLAVTIAPRSLSSSDNFKKILLMRRSL